jgi:hypothetical protein
VDRPLRHGDAKIVRGSAAIFNGTQAAFDRRLGTRGLGPIARAAQSELGSTVLLGQALWQRVADVRFH